MGETVSGHRHGGKLARTLEKRGSQRGKGDFGPDAFDSGRRVSSWALRASDSEFPESNQQVTVASTGRPSEVPNFRVLGQIAVSAGECTQGPGSPSQAWPGPAPARVSGGRGGADGSGRGGASLAAGDRGCAFSVSRDHRRTLMGAAGSLGTRAPSPPRLWPQSPQSSPPPGSGLRAATWAL